MTSEVPPNFDVPWTLSDVVLRTNNSDGKDIHAYKAALAMFSPYFRVLFFGNFKENGEATVNVDCDHDVMVDILRSIHQIGFEYAVWKKPYSSEMIVKMYTTADKFDFAFIRKLCLDHMEGYATIDMAKAAGELNMLDLRMKIWMKMTREDLYKFLHHTNYKYSLSKDEFRMLFNKVVGEPLPITTESYPIKTLNLEEITQDLDNPRIDLTKFWPSADLAIITNNSRGRVLYANKTVVETMCQNLHKYLCTTDELQLEGPKMFIARIAEHYVTVKEIFSLMHVCNTNFRKERVLHPVLLHDMFWISQTQCLDIPFIRDWCVTKLIEYKSVDAVEVLADRNLLGNMKEALEMLSTTQLRDWVYRKDNHLCYRDGSRKVEVYTNERFINAEITCWLIKKFKEEFYPDVQLG